MTVKELKSMLKDISDDAQVFVEANYGDNKESAKHLIVTRDNLDNDICG